MGSLRFIFMKKILNSAWWMLLIFLLTATTGYAADRALKKVDDQGSGYRRIALVIGNSRYAFTPLKNPVQDASDLATELQRAGFVVTLKVNVDRAELFALIRDFGDRLREGGVGLFYFAGHGVNVNGKNYLIPIHADIQREDEVPSESIEADLVLRKLESANNGLNMVILDACRDNPFSTGSRSLSGLGRMEAPSGTLLVYATRPGHVAEDGTGENSVFTKHFISRMRIPGLDFVTLIGDVAAAVEAETNNRQQPWIEGSPKGARFCFYEQGKTGTATTAADRASSNTAKKGAQDINPAHKEPVAQQPVTKPQESVPPPPSPPASPDPAKDFAKKEPITQRPAGNPPESASPIHLPLAPPPPAQEKNTDITGEDGESSGNAIGFREYLHSDLGDLNKGDIVEVTLTAAANVRIMDPENFLLYKDGLQFQYYGEHFLESPAKITIPETGHWHLSIDMDGLGGSASASSVTIYKGATGKK
jgi:hypothetical protein